MLTFYNEEWDFFMFEQFLGNSYLIVVWQLLSVTFGFLLLSKYLMTLMMKELADKLDDNAKKDHDERIMTLNDISFKNIFTEGHHTESDSLEDEDITKIVPMPSQPKNITSFGGIDSENGSSVRNSSIKLKKEKNNRGVSNSEVENTKGRKQICFNLENGENK